MGVLFAKHIFKYYTLILLLILAIYLSISISIKFIKKKQETINIYNPINIVI